MVLVLSLLVLALTMPAMAQEARPVSKVLITNANILDSNKGTLAEGMSLLVEGNKIAKIAKSIPAPDGYHSNVWGLRLGLAITHFLVCCC